ncbi:uncharacterized protein LOC122659495 [Telopea speciosissima]|uniref:uncharacterized protein LOC122659495 n=1 Tax=Telopea speciosissima TaxID=54955 RepID=UPI001CC55E37|nr:uncharacterized protein LOC122659495 [Telopea speciosissima]
MGCPAVIFIQEEIDRFEVPFRFSLIAKCAYGRPSIFEVKAGIQSMFHLVADVAISSLDQRPLLLRFVDQSNFVKVWLKEQVHIRGFPFRFFKWSRHFRPGTESSIVPVWVSFPGLLVNLYQGNYLRSVVGAIGNVTRVDGATAGCTRTVATRVCVELDLSDHHPEKVWIDCGADGFFQKVIYERLPAFCTTCSKVGHFAENYRRTQGRGAASGLDRAKGRGDNTEVKQSGGNGGVNPGAVEQVAGQASGEAVVCDVGAREVNRALVAHSSVFTRLQTDLGAHGNQAVVVRDEVACAQDHGAAVGGFP